MRRHALLSLVRLRTPRLESQLQVISIYFLPAYILTLMLIPYTGNRMERVQLGLMDQLAEAKSADDNWTGLRDRAERRKRQTRLSLRALRTFF